MRILLFYGLDDTSGEPDEPRGVTVGADRLEVGINRHAHIGCRLRGIILRGLASQMCGRPKLQLALKWMVLVV